MNELFGDPSFLGSFLSGIIGFAGVIFGAILAWHFSRREDRNRRQKELLGIAMALGQELNRGVSTCKVQAYLLRTQYHKKKGNGISGAEMGALLRNLSDHIYLENAPLIGQLPKQLLIAVYEAYGAIDTHRHAKAPIDNFHDAENLISEEHLRKWADVYDDVRVHLEPAVEAIAKFVNSRLQTE